MLRFFSIFSEILCNFRKISRKFSRIIFSGKLETLGAFILVRARRQIHEMSTSDVRGLARVCPGNIKSRWIYRGQSEAPNPRNIHLRCTWTSQGMSGQHQVEVDLSWSERGSKSTKYPPCLWRDFNPPIFRCNIYVVDRSIRRVSKSM